MSTSITWAMEETNIGDNVNLIMLTIRVELQQRLGGYGMVWYTRV